MTFRTLALAAALATVPAAAFAAPPSVAVKVADLDLSTPQGQAKLDKRIDRAAKEVCTSRVATTGSIVSSTVDQTCYKEARQKVQEQVAMMTGHKLQG